MADYAVALGGGIASGKSAVSAAFAALGITIVDTDQGARAVVALGTAGLTAVTTEFGPDILAADGTLDRRRLRDIVFRDTDARRRLEAILHPLIRNWSRDSAAAATTAYVIVAVPLLAETWPAYAWVNRVLIVDAPEALQTSRLMARDGLDAAAAARMLATQASRAERLALADDIIVNDAAPESLTAVVGTLHARYLRLAAVHD